MTPQERIAHRRAVAHRLAVQTLTSDLRGAGLDIYWESGEVPRLSDGRLTPWTTLAARHPYLAQRVDELFGPDARRCELVLKDQAVEQRRAKERQKTSTGGSNPQLVPNLAQADKGKTRDVLAARAGVSHPSLSHCPALGPLDQGSTIPVALVTIDTWRRKDE